MDLSAAMLLADPRRPQGPGAALTGLSLDDSSEFVATADGVIRFLALESAAGADPLWSPFVEALATKKDAPKDGNGNGTNRDEVLAALRARYEFRTNAKLPVDLGQAFFAPEDLPALLGSVPLSRTDAKHLRLAAAPARRYELAPGSLGTWMTALTRRAARLLSVGRGDLYGETGESGMRGLLMLEKAIAIERFLLSELAFDGQALGRIQDPANYDASKAPKLFPARIHFAMAHPIAGLPAAPEAFAALDRSSSLVDQARLLRGCAELAWLASKRQPNSLLRRLFEGDPFGKGPQARPGAADASRSGSGSPSAVVTWESHMKGLLNTECGTCHGQFPSGDFVVLTYKDVLRGGAHRKTNPTVVQGKSRQSLLWQIVALKKPPVSRRMPDFLPPLPQSQIDLIGEWIDSGALEKDPGQKTVEPRPGLDGVEVLVRNLIAMHRDPATGALVDRADRQGRGALVEADSAGEALLGLAAARQAVPELNSLVGLLREHALFVAKNLVDRDGQVRASVLLAPSEFSTAPAAFGAAASVIAGLFESYRVLGLPELRASALRAASYWADHYVRVAGGPVSFPGAVAAGISPSDLARALDAVAAWQAVQGAGRLGDLAARVWARSKASGLVLAEWPATGEVFGDQNADSDGDGVPEVGHELRPPLFAPGLENRDYQAGVGVPGRRVRYGRDLMPTLIAQCGQCHAGGASRGGFQLDTYADLFRGGDFRDRMTNIVPGKPAKSLFWRKLEDRPPPFGVQMPDGLPPVSPAFRALVKLWIEQGAARN